MKKLILTILLTTALIFAFEVRDSESGKKPARFRRLQGGVLIAYNIEKVKTDSILMYKYDEVLLKNKKNIDRIPDQAGLADDEIEYLQGYNSLETSTYWQVFTIQMWLKDRGITDVEGLTKNELQSMVQSYLDNQK